MADTLADLNVHTHHRAALDASMRWIASVGRLHDRDLALEHFAQQYPRSVFIRAIKTAVESGDTDDLNLLPPALLDPLVRAIQADTVLAKIPGLVRAPLNVPIPIVTTDPEFVWVRQGGPKPPSVLAVTSLRLDATKGAAIVVVTAELARTEGAEGVIRARLISASTRFVDSQFLNPAVAAVADKNPASITHGGTSVPAGGDVLETVNALTAAFFAQRPDAIAPSFVVSPQTLGILAAQQLAPDGRVLGFPTTPTPGAGDALVLLDAAGVYVHDGGASIDVSRYAAIEMQAPPTDPPVAATITRDLWGHNEVGILCERFVSWASEPDAVAYTVLPGAARLTPPPTRKAAR